jgi:hypothetical protein
MVDACIVNQNVYFPPNLKIATLGPCTVQSPMQRHWAQAGEMEIFVSAGGIKSLSNSSFLDKFPGNFCNEVRRERLCLRLARSRR